MNSNTLTFSPSSLQNQFKQVMTEGYQLKTSPIYCQKISQYLEFISQRYPRLTTGIDLNKVNTYLTTEYQNLSKYFSIENSFDQNTSKNSYKVNYAYSVPICCGLLSINKTKNLINNNVTLKALAILIELNIAENNLTKDFISGKSSFPDTLAELGNRTNDILEKYQNDNIKNGLELNHGFADKEDIHLKDPLYYAMKSAKNKSIVDTNRALQLLNFIGYAHMKQLFEHESNSSIPIIAPEERLLHEFENQNLNGCDIEKLDLIF